MFKSPLLSINSSTLQKTSFREIQKGWGLWSKSRYCGFWGTILLPIFTFWILLIFAFQVRIVTAAQHWGLSWGPGARTVEPSYPKSGRMSWEMPKSSSLTFWKRCGEAQRCPQRSGGKLQLQKFLINQLSSCFVILIKNINIIFSQWGFVIILDMWFELSEIHWCDFISKPINTKTSIFFQSLFLNK